MQKLNRLRQVGIPVLASAVMLAGNTYRGLLTPSLPDVQAAEKTTAAETTTPLKYVVVIFQENRSFDHYFATYPEAANDEGEPAFTPLPRTPSVNGLTPELITHNPNSTKPFRLARSQAATCDQGHDYTPEQQAFDAGLMDKFPEFTGVGTSCDPGQVMAYFDGNTVTALWNYAQHFAMSDNFFNTTFGPSTPGALNLISGQTHGASPGPGTTLATLQTDEDVAGCDPSSVCTVIGDPQPAFDDCSTRETVQLSGKNVGDLLNAKGITWGWFQGGFTPSQPAGTTSKAKCDTAHIGSDGNTKKDYIPHHEPFQYYASTANPKHLPPTSAALVGFTDQANHQYDLSDFWAAAAARNVPAVSFLKAPGYQDGHPGYSDPLAEQTFVVETLNRLQKLPQWKSMAVIIAYDDSDGWYDHVMGPIVSQSNTTADALTGASSCGTAPASSYQGRCGYGPRLPLLVISPFAKVNFVDHTTTDQSSILRLIEDNWNLGRIGDQSFNEKAGALSALFDFDRPHNGRRLFLDPETGLVSKR